VKEPDLATHCQRGSYGASCNGRCGSNCRFGCSVSGNCFGWNRGGCDHCVAGYYGKTCGSRYTLVSKVLHCTGVGRVLKSTVAAIGMIAKTASCQACQFVLADGRGALIESLGEQTAMAFETVLKSRTAKLISATKGIPIIGAAANFALADNVCERIKVVTTFTCELGAGAAVAGGAVVSAGILSVGGLFAFAACATVGAGVEGACNELAPTSWSKPSGPQTQAKHYFEFIDKKGTDNVCSVVCPPQSQQQRRREALAAVTTTLAANITWPASFVALASIDTGVGEERRVLLAQSKARNTALALTLGANDTWVAQWQQCSDAGATMASQVGGVCGITTPQPFCPSNLPQAILVQVVSDALARVSGARNTTTPSDFVEVSDFEGEQPDNATIVLGNEVFLNATHWRARIDVNASDNSSSIFGVLFQQSADGRPLALSIELDLEPRFVMVFWAIDTTFNPDIVVPSCCSGANSTCASSTSDLASNLLQVLNKNNKSTMPLESIVPKMFLETKTSETTTSTTATSPSSSSSSQPPASTSTSIISNQDSTIVEPLASCGSRLKLFSFH
jgi:hypothetical protein